jgi:tetratricopeptide (TPR) repeat protein
MVCAMDHHIRYLLDRGEDGDDEEALRLVDDALVQAPGMADLLVLRSEALRNLDLYEEAVAAARSASRAHESAAHTHAALGEALLDLADENDDPALLEEAKEAFEAALVRDPDLSSAHYWLAECSIRLGSASEGLVRMAGVARTTGWDQAALTRVARLVDEGVRPLPLEDRDGPRWHPDENLLLGMALRRAGDLEGARTEFDTERTFDPLSREPDYQSARVTALAGDSTGALDQLTWPCEAEGFYEAWVLRGEILASLGRATEARAAIEHALPAARRWADPSVVEALEIRLLNPLEGAAPSAADGANLQDEILRAMLREQRLASAHDSPQSHSLQMARAAMARYAQSGRSEDAAWRIARTARAHTDPRLAGEAWSAGVTQAGDAWEELTTTEGLALSGLIVLAAWFATSGEFEGRDCGVLAAGALALTEHAIRDAEQHGRTVTAYDERLEGMRAQLRALEAEGPVGLDAAGRFVEAVIGLPGGVGLMHELANLRPRRRL